MKKKKQLTAKNIIFFSVVSMILITGILILSTQLMEKTPYSFKNTGYFGNALFYDTLENLGYAVTYEISPMSQIDSNGLIIINVAGASKDISDTDYSILFDYVGKGGKVLVLSIDANYLKTPDQGEFELVTTKSPFQKWETNKGGVLLYGDIYLLDNINISSERNLTYEVLKEIHPYMNENGVEFNEYYLFVHEGERSLWKEIPLGIKFILYQLLLLIIVFIAYKGKRFGAPLTLYEEAEPDEHQYAKAVGELYYQAGHWEVLLDSYYHHLLSKIYRKYLLYTDINESNWIEVFVENHKYHKIANKVFNFMMDYENGKLKNYSKKKKNKKIKEVLMNIQSLEKSLD